MTNDLKDRHVLAAAVHANAKLIVTDNIKDFPALSVQPYDIDVRSPDDFLLDQLDLHQEETLEIVDQILQKMVNPSCTWAQYVQSLYHSMALPLFAAELKRLGPAES